MKKQIENQIKNILENDYNIIDVDNNNSLLMNLLLDSMSFVAFILSLEKEFNISIPFLEYDIDYVSTINGLVEIISQKLESGNGN